MTKYPNKRIMHNNGLPEISLLNDKSVNFKEETIYFLTINQILWLETTSLRKSMQFIKEAYYSPRWTDVVYSDSIYKEIRAWEYKKMNEWIMKFKALKNVPVLHIPKHWDVREHTRHLLDLQNRHPIRSKNPEIIEALKHLPAVTVVHDWWETWFKDTSQSEWKTEDDRDAEYHAGITLINDLYTWESKEYLITLYDELEEKWALRRVLKIYEEMSHINWIIYLKESGYWKNIEEWAIEKHLKKLIEHCNVYSEFEETVNGYLKEIWYQPLDTFR